MLWYGRTDEDNFDAYPELEEKDIRLAVLYAEWLSPDQTRKIPQVIDPVLRRASEV